MKNEPKRHHYIPQFILRNFCFDNTKEQTLYFDKSANMYQPKMIRDIFMVENLYCDEFNSPNDRMKIEKNFGRFENEVSQIINKVILCKDNVFLTTDENEKLKLFFALMGFRSKNTYISLTQNAQKETLQFYSHFFKSDRDISDLWKRNLDYLVNCRSLQNVLEHKNIDEIIKFFMIRDICGINNIYKYYFCYFPNIFSSSLFFLSFCDRLPYSSLKEKTLITFFSSI